MSDSGGRYHPAGSVPGPGGAVQGRPVRDDVGDHDDLDEEEFGADDFDGDHPGGAPPEPEPPAGPPTVPCWNCAGHRPDGPEDCPRCLSPRAQLVLRLDPPGPRLTAAPGRPLRLGRDPGWAPTTAPALGGSPGVSRRHATLTVANDGTAWVAEATGTGSLNGIWLNGRRVPPDTPQPLHDGDHLALGHRVHGTIHLHPPR
jgi:hypothetical protein